MLSELSWVAEMLSEHSGVTCRLSELSWLSDILSEFIRVADMLLDLVE